MASEERRLEEAAVTQEACSHPREQWKYLRTREDWYDGDEDDIYECGVCGKQIEVYIPR